MTISGDELSQWRKTRSLSQEALGKKLGVSDAAVNRWENGQAIPSPVQLLLGLLMYGKNPFSQGDEEESNPLTEAHFTLAEYEVFERERMRLGFNSVRDLLTWIAKQHVAAIKAAGSGASKAPVLLKAAEAPAKYQVKKGA